MRNPPKKVTASAQAGGGTSLAERPYHEPPQKEKTIGLDSHVLPRRTGLQFPSALSFETWHRIGRQLHLISDSSNWWLGDWLVYGETKYPDRYQRAIESSSLDYKTLRNYAWIARRIPLCRRRAGLSMSHHAEVAGLPEKEQDTWLQRAEQERWSRNRLRREIQTAATPGLPAAEPIPQQASSLEPTVEVVHIEVSKEERHRWDIAAREANFDLTAWIRWLVDKEISAHHATT